MTTRRGRPITKAICAPARRTRDTTQTGGHCVSDKYESFQSLSSSESCDADFRIRVLDRGTPTVIVAPHGGGIERGTSEIAEAIAGEEYSLYLFEGLKDHGNGDLHITSTRFDEPQCLMLLERSHLAVTVHGCDNSRRDHDRVHLGGLDQQTCRRVEDALRRTGFPSVRDRDTPGAERSNICNRVISGRGIQLEIPESVRASMFESLTRRGRKRPTPRLHQFANAIRAVLAAERA
jgi:phage replication-related protein YjqB (UPF0714/DUF867 family)